MILCIYLFIYCHGLSVSCDIINAEDATPEVVFSRVCVCTNICSGNDTILNYAVVHTKVLQNNQWDQLPQSANKLQYIQFLGSNLIPLRRIYSMMLLNIYFLFIIEILYKYFYLLILAISYYSLLRFPIFSLSLCSQLLTDCNSSSWYVYTARRFPAMIYPSNVSSTRSSKYQSKSATNHACCCADSLFRPQCSWNPMSYVMY